VADVASGWPDRGRDGDAETDDASWREAFVATQPTERVGTRLMHEDERVRVWDLALAPGETLEKHVHRLDYLFVVVSGGLIRFADPDDPSVSEDIQFEDDEVVFVEVGPDGKVDNRLTNVGKEYHRNFVVELKRG
jgi:predicted metal-dependent enzyme (double-stranded beta helix superfamily)